MTKQNVCLCGCFQPVNRMYVNGHNNRGKPISKEVKVKLSIAAKAAKLPIGSKSKSSGYIFIKTIDGWRREHRVVMEKKLGRKLASDEVPHHKNNNKTDNRRKNLRLMNFGRHSSMHRREAIHAKNYGGSRV